MPARWKTCLLAALAGLHCSFAGAASSAASMASESIGFSIGSISGSITRSSASSSQTTTAVAPGDYRVVEIAVVDARPGMLRLALEPAAPDAGQQAFGLELPRETVAQARLAPGRLVTAQARPYGIEFAAGEPRQAFFLVLADDWYRELHAVPL